jgi:hypothetical protein
MANRINGTARLTIGRFMYDWDHRDYCLLAYTSDGNMGVVATVPDENGDAPDLWSIAARHESRTATHEDLGRWCLCAGWALTMKPADQWFSVVDQTWGLEVRNTLASIKPHQYGNTAYGWNGAYVGVLTVEDPEIRKRAHGLLSAAKIL